MRYDLAVPGAHRCDRQSLTHYSHSTLLQTATSEFAKTMILCDELAQESAGSENELERKDLFTTRAEVVLRPLFRYCRYELKELGVAVVDEPNLSSATTMTPPSDQDSIAFRGQEILIDDKDLRVLLLKLQSLTDSQESTFLQALSTLDDALALVHSNLQALEGTKPGPAVNAKRQQLKLWTGYITWQKIARVMDHTGALLRTIDGHAERVHVYDALLQHAQKLLQLPSEEEDDEFALQAQANILRLRALKSFHVAMYYLQRQQCAHSWAMIKQSQSLRGRALEEIAACDEDMPHHAEYMEELEELDIKLQGATAAIKAISYFQDKSSTEVRKTNRPLLQRLHEPDAGTILADTPPIFMPIPCKPVFYDLAYDMAVDTGAATDLIQKYIDLNSTERTKSSGGGFLGWFSSK